MNTAKLKAVHAQSSLCTQQTVRDLLRYEYLLTVIESGTNG